MEIAIIFLVIVNILYGLKIIRLKKRVDELELELMDLMDEYEELNNVVNPNSDIKLN
jgi:hypothetical protein